MKAKIDLIGHQIAKFGFDLSPTFSRACTMLDTTTSRQCTQASVQLINKMTGVGNKSTETAITK